MNIVWQDRFSRSKVRKFYQINKYFTMASLRTKFSRVWNLTQCLTIFNYAILFLTLKSLYRPQNIAVFLLIILLKGINFTIDKFKISSKQMLTSMKYQLKKLKQIPGTSKHSVPQDHFCWRYRVHTNIPHGTTFADNIRMHSTGKVFLLKFYNENSKIWKF